jgi:hypothetical protein
MSFFFFPGLVKLISWSHNMGFNKIITAFGFSNENKCVEFEDRFASLKDMSALASHLHFAKWMKPCSCLMDPGLYALFQIFFCISEKKKKEI